MHKTTESILKRIGTLLFATSLLALVGCSAGCATSSSVLTGKTYLPTDVTEIQILAEFPAEYEIIGLIEASAPRGYLRNPKTATQKAMLELKKQAAGLGAQAIVLEGVSTDFVPDFSVGDTDDWGVIFTSERRSVRGKAIRLP